VISRADNPNESLLQANGNNLKVIWILVYLVVSSSCQLSKNLNEIPAEVDFSLAKKESPIVGRPEQPVKNEHLEPTEALRALHGVVLLIICIPFLLTLPH